MTPQRIAAQLGDTGLCICPNFLSAKFLHEIREDIADLQKGEEFHRASVGQGPQKQIHGHVRNDEIFWLDRLVLNSVQAKLWHKVEILQQALNRKLFLGLNEFEGHYATYAEGGFYKRHLDCFQKNKDRIVSVIIYLNQDWRASHGGQLRVYSEESHQDINPLGGTLVCFMSRESEHEVLQSHFPRCSFTGWFKSV